MNIAFFTDTYVPTPDGVATFASSLARALSRQGHSVRVCTTNPVKGAPPESTVIEGIPVLRARSVPIPIYNEYRWALYPFWQVRAAHVGDWADVIHLHTPGMVGWTGFVTGRRHHKPVVGTFHTNVWEARQAFPKLPGVQLAFRGTWWFVRGLYWRCTATTAPTVAARDYLLGASTKPYARPMEVIPNGIDIDRFHPGVTKPDWRARCGLPDGPLVTYLGRITADKGVHRFLDTVTELMRQRDLVAIVGGAGLDEEAVARRCRDDPILRTRARFVGRVHEEEKAALLSQSDLFVLPSTSDTSSIAVLEALACGVPVVVSDVGGAGELVEEGVVGRRAPILEPGGLTRTVGDLLADPARLNRMRGAAVAYVDRRGSIDVTARRFIRLYESVLAEGPGPAARVA